MHLQFLLLRIKWEKRTMSTVIVGFQEIAIIKEDPLQIKLGCLVTSRLSSRGRQ